MDRFKDFKPLIPDDESSSVEGDLRHEDDVVHDVMVAAGDVRDSGASNRPNKPPNELGYSVLSSIEPVDSTLLGSGETSETLSNSGLVRHLPGHDTMYGEPIACSTGFSFFQPEIIDSLNGTEEETLKDDGFNGKIKATEAEISQHTISDGSDSRDSPSYSPVVPESSGKGVTDVLRGPEFGSLNNGDKQTSLSQHSLDSQESEGSTLSQHLMVVSDAADLVPSFDSLIRSSTNNRIGASQLRVVDAYSGSARGKSPASLKDGGGNSLPQFNIVDVFVGSGKVGVRSENRSGVLPQFEILDAVHGCIARDASAESLDGKNLNLLTEQIDFSAVKIPESISARCDVESCAEDVGNKSLPTQLQKIPVKSAAMKLTDASNLDKAPSGIVSPVVAATRNDQLSTGSFSCPNSLRPVVTSSDNNQSVVTEIAVSKSKDDIRNLGTLAEGHVNAKGKPGYMYNSMLLKDREDGMLAKIKKPRVWMPLELDKSSDSESAVSSLNKQEQNGSNDFGITRKNNPLQDMETQKVREVNNFPVSIPGFPSKSNEMENSVRLSVDVLHASIGDTLVHSSREPLGSSTPVVRENREAVEKIQALQAVPVLDSEDRSDSGRASRGSTVKSLEPDHLEKYDLKPGVGCFSLEEKLSDQDPGGKCDRNTMSIRDELRIAFKSLCDDVGTEEITNIARNMIGRSGFGKSSSCSSCASLSPAISLRSVKHLHGDVDVQNVSVRTLSRSSVADSVKDFEAPIDPLIAKLSDNYRSCEDLRMRQEPIGASTEELKVTFPISSANLKILNSSSKMKFVKKDSYSEDSDASDVDKVRELYQSYLDDDLESNERAVTVENLNESSERKGEGCCLGDSEENKIPESDDWKKNSTLMKSHIVPGRDEIIGKTEKLERSSSDIKKLTASEAPSHIMETLDAEIAAEVPDDLLASSLPSSGFSGSDADDGLSEDVRRILLKYGRRFPKFIPLGGIDLNVGREIPDIVSEIGENPDVQSDASRGGNMLTSRVEVNGESSSESSDDTLGKRVSALLAKTNETFGSNDKVDCVPPPKPSSCQSSVASSGTGSVDYDVLLRDLDELEMSLDSMKKRDLEGGHFAHPTNIHSNLFQRPDKAVYEDGQAASNGSHLHLLSRNLLDVDRIGEGKDGRMCETRQQVSVLGHPVLPLPPDPVTCDSLSNAIPITSPATDAIVPGEDEMDRLSRCRISTLPASFIGVDYSANTRSEKPFFANVVTKRGSSYGGISLSELSEVRSLDGAEAGDVTPRRGSDVSQGSTVPSFEVELGRNLAVRNAAITGVDGGDNKSSSGYSGSGSLARSEASLSSAARSSVLSGIIGRTRDVELESELGKRPKSCGFASTVKSQMEIKRNLLLSENHDQSLTNRGLLVSNPKAKIGNDYRKLGETITISHVSNTAQNFDDISSREFQPVDNRASRSLPAAAVLSRDSSEPQMKLDVQCKKALGNSVAGIEFIRTNQENVGIGNNSTSDLEDSVSFEAHVDKNAQVLTDESEKVDRISDVHESDSFEDIFQKPMPANKPVGMESQIEEICDGKSVKDIERRHGNERDTSHLVEDFTDSDTDRHLTNANESRNRFISPVKKPYSSKNFGIGNLNDSQNSSETLVSCESLVTDDIDSALKLDDRMHPEVQSDPDSQSRDDPVSSNGALRTSLTTVTSLRDSTDSDGNSVLDHKGTNGAVIPAALPAMVPYKPASGSEVYYVDSGPEEGSLSAAVSDATVESTHPSSDDARAPNFPVNVLGSRSDAPMDTMTQKNKMGHALVSTVTNLSNISERSEIGNLSASKLNQLAEKSRKQELQQLQEKTKNWVNGISASLPDMCTPLRVDKASHASLSESEIITGSRDRIVTGLAADFDGKPLPHRSLGRNDQAADEIGNCQHKPGIFDRVDAVPASGGNALAGSEIHSEKSRPGVKTLDFGDYIANDRLLFEMNKHFSQHQLPGDDGGGGIGGSSGGAGGGHGGGGSASKGLNPEQLSARLENRSGMTSEILALLEKYAGMEVSEKYDRKDKKELHPSLQSMDSSNKQSSAETGVEQTQNLNSNAAKVTGLTEKSAAMGVSRDEFTKRLWERFHESGRSSSGESESNDRRAHSSVMRLVSIMKNPTHHYVKHLQSEREERSKTDDELTAFDLSGSHSMAGISMRSAESCRTYTIVAGQVRSHGLESASGTKGQRADDSNGCQGQQTGGKDSSEQRSRSYGTNPGIGVKRLSANGAGERSSSDDDRPRRKNLPAWQEFGDFEELKKSAEKNEKKLDRAKSVVVESKRAWTIVVDDETLPSVPEDAVLETASSNLTQSSLDEVDNHATRSTAHRFSDDPKLVRLQQKIAHQKEKYRRAYAREHRRKLKIAQLEQRYKSEAGVEASGVGSSLESFSQPPSVRIGSMTAASTASESSVVCLSCSESDGGACICVRLKSKHSVMKQLVPEEPLFVAKPKASPPQKKLRESSAPAIVLDLREVDYSEGGQRKKESSPRARRPHAGHTRQPAARSPSKPSRIVAAKSPVRRTASHGVSVETKSPFFPDTKSGTQIVDMAKKISADDTRKGRKSECLDFGMTFPTPRQEVEKCSRGVQTTAPAKVQSSQRKPYRGSRPYDVGVISIPVAGKMRVKHPCGDLHLHGSLVSDVSVHGHSQQVQHRTKSHRSKQRKPLPRGISWFVPLKENIVNKNQKLDHFGYHGVSSDWMSDKPFRCDSGNKENSGLSKLSSITVTKETLKDYDQVTTTISDNCDILRENTFNSLNNSNSTKIISKSGENFPFGSDETVVPSLQQCFRARMQTFMLRSQQRERRISLRAEERRMKELLEKQRMQLIGNGLKGTSASRRDPISDQLFKPKKRWFTKQQMKTMTYRRYRNLPEVMKMVEERQKSEQFRANRQRVQMFKQRILNHVLGEKNKRVAA